MSDATENLPPQVMRIILRQIKKLMKSPPSGVRYIPHDENVTEGIYAELDGPADTPYAGGKFTVKLVIGREFPAAPPKGYFLTKIYHPNVAPAGDICVNTLKRDWKPDLGIGHVLKIIWCLLLVPFPESSLNDEAGKLFMESYDDYAKKARMITKIYAMKNKAKAASSSGASSASSASSSICRKKSAAKVDAHFPAKKAKCSKHATSSHTIKKKKKSSSKSKSRGRYSRKKSLKRL